MATYAMALKESKDSNGIVFKTNSNSLEAAQQLTHPAHHNCSC